MASTKQHCRNRDQGKTETPPGGLLFPRVLDGEVDCEGFHSIVILKVVRDKWQPSASVILTCIPNSSKSANKGHYQVKMSDTFNRKFYLNINLSIDIEVRAMDSVDGEESQTLDGCLIPICKVKLRRYTPIHSMYGVETIV